MNSNNWLPFPLSPTQSHLQSSNSSSQFSLGFIRESMDNPFQPREWNIMNCQSSNDVPKVADFLGVGKSENQPAMVSFTDIPASNPDSYFFPSSNPVSVQSTLLVTAPSNAYEFQENGTNLQTLTLSMGSATGKGSTCDTSDNSANTVEAVVPRRTLDTFGQRTSIYRGVTRHRWTGRYEAHLWDNSCRREGQSRKGRQVYLGGYDKEEKAARAYDLAALKYWGTSTTTNFPISNYETELEDMKHMTRQEFVAAIRRNSSGFSRGASRFRGVTKHHQQGRWQARIGRVAGNKDLYLGTFSTEEEAAEAYDIAAIKFRGLNAVTNFDMSRYDVKSILESNTLPIGGGAAKRLKEAQAIESSRKREEMMTLGSAFQYGSSSATSRLLPYSLMQSPYDQPSQPLLTLQNADMSHYAQDSSFHQNYLQTQLHLHQNSPSTYLQNHPQLVGSSYNIQSNPVLLHGLFGMGATSATSVMENHGGSSSNYSAGGYFGNGLGMGSNSASSSVVGSGHHHDPELTLVKVDYDLQSGGYGGWPADSIHGSNPGVFYNVD